MFLAQRLFQPKHNYASQHPRHTLPFKIWGQYNVVVFFFFKEIIFHLTAKHIFRAASAGLNAKDFFCTALVGSVVQMFRYQ